MVIKKSDVIHVGHYYLAPRCKTDSVTGLAYSRRTYEQMLRDVDREFEECTMKTTEDIAADPVPKGPPGEVTTTVKLNIRKGASNTRVSIYQTVPRGTRLSHIGIIEAGEAVNGNPAWYADKDGNYFLERWGCRLT